MPGSKRCSSSGSVAAPWPSVVTSASASSKLRRALTGSTNRQSFQAANCGSRGVRRSVALILRPAAGVSNKVFSSRFAARSCGATQPASRSVEKRSASFMRSGRNSCTLTTVLPMRAAGAPSLTMYSATSQAPVGEDSDVACASSSKPLADSRRRWRRTTWPRGSLITASSGRPSTGCAQSAALTIRPIFSSSPGR